MDIKERLDRIAEVFMQISGALILLIPPILLLVQFVKHATRWAVIYLIAVIVVATGMVALESYMKKSIGELLEFGSSESSYSDEKNHNKEQPHLGNCEGTIPTPRSLSLKSVKKHRKDVQLSEGGQGQIPTN